MSRSFFATLLQAKLESVEAAVNASAEFRTSAGNATLHFAISANGDDECLSVLVKDGAAHLALDSSRGALFSLSARSEDWEQFFAPVPKAPYQSYWGMLRVLGQNRGVSISGDVTAFGMYARIWRMTLDLVRDSVRGPLEEADIDEAGDDAVVGRYVWIDCPGWGKSRIFYEAAGDGPQDILFLHTAGADSQQYHSLMNNEELRKRCTMYAFDLPGHGRSRLGSKQIIEGHTNDEEAYVGSIRLVIEKLKLNSPVVCGASMAGHVCLAVAIHAATMNVSGVIPLEATDHLPLDQPIYEMTGDESVLNPERVCGMTAPTSPAMYKRLIWWNYSSQGARIFQGDLKFYFRGWDGRGRVEKIDTQRCPVYMLTGEYDYSCTPEASEATAKKIPGASFAVMKGLGHFPATENPPAFVPHLLRGLNHIQEHHRSSPGH